MHVMAWCLPFFHLKLFFDIQCLHISLPGYAYLCRFMLDHFNYNSFENPGFAKNVSGQSWDEKKEWLVQGSNSDTHCHLHSQSNISITLYNFANGPNLDLTYVTNQTPCPNGLTHPSRPKSPLTVRICPFCPRPNGRNLTTSVRIWSLTLVPIFRGPGIAS